MKKLFLLGFALMSLLEVSAREYNIVGYGAKNDTTQLSSGAIQKAIDDCNAAGGGVVVVPTGMYKMGSIILKSHVGSSCVLRRTACISNLGS